MTIVSVQFFAFIIGVVALYYIVPKKIQWIVIMLANITFYLFSGVGGLVVMLLSVTLSYLVGLFMKRQYKKQNKESEGLERKQKKPIKQKYSKIRKRSLVIALIIQILILAVVKYLGFFFDILNNLIGLSPATLITADNITSAIPQVLGCSYFSFIIIAYLVDVYRGKIEAQSNFLKYFTFVSFFPHITQGPIGRYDKLSNQIFDKTKLNFTNIKTGATLMLWGLFKKLIISNMLSPISADIFKNYQDYSAFGILFGTAAFSIQIYTDWTAYCDIVGGSAEMLGITIAKNFDRPYFSQTMPEFWRRWHMTMASFFKDYVLYPISASPFCLKINKYSRKFFGNGVGRVVSSSLPILSVWFLTGLWHGASVKFIFWGLYQGVVIMFSVAFNPLIQKINTKCHFKTETFAWTLFRVIRTFFICCMGRVFFNTASLSDAVGMFKRLLIFDMSPIFSNFDYLPKQWVVLGIALLVHLIVSLLQNKYEVRRELDKQPIVFKWLMLYMLIMSIVIFGVYGSGAGVTSFIYEDF